MGIVTQEQPAEIECPICSGVGCSKCDKGWYRVESCPKRYIGQSLTSDINLVVMCKSGSMLVDGGILDQPNAWVELKNTLEHEEALIERDQAERRKNG